MAGSGLKHTANAHVIVGLHDWTAMVLSHLPSRFCGSLTVHVILVAKLISVSCKPVDNSGKD